MYKRLNLLGITLVEIMVAILLSSLVLGAGYKIWSNAQKDAVLASTRQKLASEVRLALDRMARDLQTAKSGTLEINAGNDGNSARIKFDKYISDTEQTKIEGNKTETVIYEYQKPILKRVSQSQGTKILATQLDFLQIARGASSNPGNNQQPDDIEQKAKYARLDIYMGATSFVPGTRKIASFASQVSVFIRDEYKSAIEENRYVSISKLIQKDTSELKDQNRDDSRLNTGGIITPETLAKLSPRELNELKVQQESALRESEQKINELNQNIAGIDTNRTIFNFVGIRVNWPSEVSDIQRAIANANSVNDLNTEIEKLQNLIDRYEEQNLRDSFANTVPNFSSLDKKSEEYKFLKEVYELKVRDRNLQKVHEQNQENKPENERTQYRSLFEDFNPANLVKGQIVNAAGETITFSETDEEFAARRARAEKIYQYKDKVDLSWMDSTEGEDRVKLYTAAKDLKDLAEAKKALIEVRETHAINLENIRRYL